MSDSDLYLADARAQLAKYRRLAERALAQVGDEDLFAVLGAEENSIAIVMKHLAGNMRSRWADFLASDGEKPDRHRDREFEHEGESRAALVAAWEAGWQCTFAALEPLSDRDLGRVVHIRGEPHTVVQAINRQLAHYAYHVGQIVQLARHFAGERWQSLSIPRGRSADWK